MSGGTRRHHITRVVCDGVSPTPRLSHTSRPAMYSCRSICSTSSQVVTPLNHLAYLCRFHSCDSMDRLSASSVCSSGHCPLAQMRQSRPTHRTQRYMSVGLLHRENVLRARLVQFPKHIRQPHRSTVKAEADNSDKLNTALVSCYTYSSLSSVHIIYAPPVRS
jgi:hypothetical protein